MGRILADIIIDGKKRNTLFDTGSHVTYIVPEAVPDSASCKKLSKPITLRLGGKMHKLSTICLIEGELEGHPFIFEALIADKGIGKIPESDREIDIVFGAYQMQFWDIKLDPRAEKLDVSGLKNREFISF